MTEILGVLSHYEFFSPIDTVEKIDGGNINKTYKIVTQDGEKFILQKINVSVFTDPEALMDNIVKVTDELKKAKTEKMLDKMRVLNIKFTVDGKSYAQSGGNYYRVYDFMAGTIPFPKHPSDTTIESAGGAFGKFVALLGEKNLGLNETIPDFHNTAKRLAALEKSYSSADDEKREEARPLYRAIKGESELISVCKRASLLPQRIVHNDTKCDNVLFDKITGEAVGVIDLDTVMNGNIIYDFGDGARSICCTSTEDERDECAVRFDMKRFEAFARGYIGEICDILTAEEKELLSYGAPLVTLELAARFLTDHLVGDKYFKTERPRHNLDRAACQMYLLKDEMRKIDKISDTVRRTIR